MNQIGEIWIEKTNRACSYETVVGASAQFIEHNESLFRQVKTSGFNNQVFIDTGLVGFLKAPDDQKENPALFIIGKKDDVIQIRGMTFQPQEIESSVERCHR